MSGVPGVSVVVCTHNGAARLPDTLAHLAAQNVPAQLAWEVVVVDNRSTDDTSAVARSAWSAHAPAPLRVVAEPVLGPRFARVRAFAEARHTLVSFVDDDNWVAPDWVETVWQVMEAHPEAGACGGDGEAATDETAGAAATPGYFWGAGLTVRAAAWEALRAKGFELSLGASRLHWARLLWQAARALADPGEGSHAVLRFDMSRGRLRGVLDARRHWHANRRRVRDAPWRRPASSGASRCAGSAASR
jgi:glycosyltransferase involved in cell wall biosynthesis